jgi:hypothetical protein
MSDEQRSDDETTEHPVVEPPRVPSPGYQPQQQAWTPPQQQAAWTPPQQQAWTPPQQQAWDPTQSPYPPAYPPQYQVWQSGYPGSYWSPRPVYATSTLVNLAAIALLVFGGLFTLFGLLLVVVASAGSAMLTELDPTYADFGAAAASFVVTVAIVILVVGILEMVAAIGLFVHRAWARWMGIILGIVGVLIGLLLVAVAFEPPTDDGFTAFAILWLATHGFAVAALAVGGEHFEARYLGR